MKEKLEALFLRYRTADEDEAELAEEMKAEIEQLTKVIGEWSRQLGGVPSQRHPGHLIRACDEAISGALRATASRDYAAAFACLRHGRSAVAGIECAWQANLAYEAARAAYEALAALLPSACEPLLTLQNLKLLLNETASLLQTGKYRQGELLARACRGRSEFLGGKYDAAPTTFQPQLEQLLALCDDVARFVPAGRADWADKAALRGVEALLRERHFALAERLLADLEVELTPHRTFLSLYRQLRPASAPTSADADVRELIRSQSWSAATSYLLDGEFSNLSARASASPAKAAGLRQQIASYLK
ncbi:MAG TPA: hypothetical protein VN256_06850 [Pyrinomonadaceae bacterium]|nr:hypothetical protein [Pyrinomonadaceae bacterium]